jgi:hypothetical protein
MQKAVKRFPFDSAQGRLFAQVLIESDRGQMRFGSPFVFSFPTMTVITLTTTAPGYQPRQEAMKPHYRRNVTLTIDIPLAPVPTRKD